LSWAEWALIASVAGAMLGIGIASLPPENNVPCETPLNITIYITGAVDNPGVFHVPAPASVKQALALSTLAADADPKKMKWESSVRQGQVIRVPHKRKSAKEKKKNKKCDSSIVEKSAV
jgi:hypothetical protein